MNNIHSISNHNKNNAASILINAIKPFMMVKKLKKQETLMFEGDVCNKIYFVKSGVIKQYYLVDGKEFIQNFFYDGDVATVYNSFLTQEPSDSNLEAVEDTELLVMSYHSFKSIAAAKPELNAHVTISMSKMNTKRVNLLLMSDGLLRYKKFLASEHEITQRVPQYMIASYLGMSPETLSRIRKKMALRKAA
jgi:CRP-like cAMP-binding protein